KPERVRRAQTSAHTRDDGPTPRRDAGSFRLYTTSDSNNAWHSKHDHIESYCAGLSTFHPDGELCKIVLRAGVACRSASERTWRGTHEFVCNRCGDQGSTHGYRFGSRQSCEGCRGTSGSKSQPNAWMRSHGGTYMTKVVKIGGALLEKPIDAVAV